MSLSLSLEKNRVKKLFLTYFLHKLKIFSVPLYFLDTSYKFSVSYYREGIISGGTEFTFNHLANSVGSAKLSHQGKPFFLLKLE